MSKNIFVLGKSFFFWEVSNHPIVSISLKRSLRGRYHYNNMYLLSQRSTFCQVTSLNSGSWQFSKWKFHAIPWGGIDGDRTSLGLHFEVWWLMCLFIPNTINRISLEGPCTSWRGCSVDTPRTAAPRPQRLRMPSTKARSNVDMVFLVAKTRETNSHKISVQSPSCTVIWTSLSAFAICLWGIFGPQ